MKKNTSDDTRSDHPVSVSNNKITFRRKYTKSKHFLQRHGSFPLPIDYYGPKLDKFHPGKREATALCPFHNERNPSFSVNLNTGKFICFACGVGGSMLTFQMKFFNQTKNEAISSLLRSAV